MKNHQTKVEVETDTVFKWSNFVSQILFLIFKCSIKTAVDLQISYRLLGTHYMKRKNNGPSYKALMSYICQYHLTKLSLSGK